MYPIVVVDFDDTIVPFSDTFFSWHNTEYGTAGSIDRMREYEYCSQLNCTIAELQLRVRAFYQSAAHASMAPLPGAVEAIARLSTTSRVVLMSSRPRSVRESTLDLIHRHFDDRHFHDYHFLGHYDSDEPPGMTKGRLSRRIGATLFIDDAHHHVTSACRVGINSLIINRPWNIERKTPKRARRVDGWNEIMSHFEGSLV